jgi:hypothetical protein
MDDKKCKKIDDKKCYKNSKKNSKHEIEKYFT